ncbi:MAG: DUF4252 domain-containing protein [Bacteroidetes bacterium]|nr:DUF4252 domain-containing protein [Bacteroidota bacterium]
MKNNLLLVFLLILLPGLAMSQNRALNKFYRQHKREAGVQNVKLPGWVIRLGSKIAKKHVDEGSGKEALGLAKNFGKVKFMYSEDGVKIPAEHVKKLHQDLLDSHFDDLIMIREGGMNLQIMVEEYGGVIHNLFMIYNDSEEGEMFFLSAKANLSLKDLSKLLKKEMKDKLEPIFDVDEEEPVETAL